MLPDRLAAIVHPVGTAERRLRLDAVMDRDEAKRHGVTGGVESLTAVSHGIPDTTWRWGNAVSTLLVPQRGMLLGLALAVIVFTQWWLSEEKGEEGKGLGKSKRPRKKCANNKRSALKARFLISLPFFPVAIAHGRRRP